MNTELEMLFEKINRINNFIEFLKTKRHDPEFTSEFCNKEILRWQEKKDEYQKNLDKLYYTNN